MSPQLIAIEAALVYHGDITYSRDHSAAWCVFEHCPVVQCLLQANPGMLQSRDSPGMEAPGKVSLNIPARISL